MQHTGQIERVTHRSRTRRQPTGKRIVLTPRDHTILQWLDRYHVLSSDVLAAFIEPKSQKRFIERLGDLFHETGLIERPPQQWDRAFALQSPAVYGLSKLGREYLLQNGPQLPQAILRPRQQPGYRVPQFQHALMTSRFVAGEELKTLKSQTERFVPVAEILQRVGKMGNQPSAPTDQSALAFPSGAWGGTPTKGGLPSQTIVPDALFGIEYQSGPSNTYRFFAVEIERTTPLRRRTLGKSSTCKKLLLYRSALHSRSYQTTLGIPNLFPIFVARDREHRKAIRELAETLLTVEELALFQFESDEPTLPKR